ncbi:uncharacterized protein LOC106953796 isoform X2 [Poecilia latipinna]|uniref:uncharacterized protein LOC106953796 isoform X2 n=1 Tax=Poecilia latipinna TaxID=48699 RepID=UPI00072E39D8|nr:PREDICTED: uncharacterized protein LOC106953796 isoform X2 [Poecilia latipinna]
MEPTVSWSPEQTEALLSLWSEEKIQHPSVVTNIPNSFTTSFQGLKKTEITKDAVFFPIKVEDSNTPCTSNGAVEALLQTSAMWPHTTVGRRRDKPTCSWSKKEVLTLLTHWANPAVQQELSRNVRNNAVYSSLSAKLASLGYNKTAQKCKEKLKKLKQDYRRIKNSNHLDGGKNIWFDIIDQVLGASVAAAQKHPETPKLSSAEPALPVLFEENCEGFSPPTNDFDTFSEPDPAPTPSNVMKETDFFVVRIEDNTASTSTAGSSVSQQAPDMFATRHVEKRKYVHTCSWSKKEVQALLAYWANPVIQEELRRNVRNNAVYNSLSAKLASLGFSKSAQKCKEKIKKLKQDYRRVKNSQHVGWARTAWFGILDEVLGSQGAPSKCSKTLKPSSGEPNEGDLEAEDGCRWSADEVQVLITLWAQPNIQKQLLASEENDEVFTYLSDELAQVGFAKTPQQCSLKVDRLKKEYAKLKQEGANANDKSDWFAIMDSVLFPEGDASKERNLSAVLTASNPPEDFSHTLWTTEEVDALLTKWAEEHVQDRLKSTEDDQRVYAQLSSELATQGFDKTTSQCRTKLRLLKQEYERIKEQKDSKAQKTRWFVIMENVFRCHKPETESGPSSVETLQQEQPERLEACGLSIPSLCLLVPTLRLMCAFAWKVIQSGNVPHYRKVEELVVLVTELSPELLTARERVQLLLRLRARFVLELCQSRSTANLLNIQPHLRIIQDLKMDAVCGQEELNELESSKSNFVEVVYALLEDAEERRRFFKEVFPIHYGEQYEATLQRLVWKFISRLDNLLPIPDIKQTAEWLSSAPSVMEECGKLVLDPEQLRTLLNFQEQQTGNPNKCLPQAQNMFLPSLSLHLKANSRQQLPVQRKGSSPDDDESQTHDNSILENLEDKQSDGVMAANCSSVMSAPLKLHRCSMCSFTDTKVSALLNHIRQEHLSPIDDAFEDRFFQNTSVGLDCELSSELLSNVATSNSQGPPYQCDKCDKRYLSKSSLIVHYRIHTGETPYLCSHCGQGFRSSAYLDLHTRVHTGERRYKCHICGKTSNQHLTRHMRMHRGEKNYLCTECGKAFLSNGELKLHMRYHTGERPYTCKHCGKGFIAKCLLTVHTRRHTGESPYRCPMCPKSFPTLRAQKKHLKIHSSKKSLQCLECGRIFRLEDTFKLHVKTHELI